MDLFGGNSSLVEHPVQPGEGGSIPTLPLHKLLRVEECNPVHVNWFIEKHHYSQSVFGITASHCFRVLDRELNSRTLGGALFGPPAAFNVSSKYDNGEPLVELRRFVLLSELPRNSESFCLGVMLRALRRHGIRRVLSYADPAQGHSGVIYAASGFVRMGESSPRRHVIWKGKTYPDRNIHQTNFPYHKDLQAALESGEATRVQISGKIVWLKSLMKD